MKLSDFFRGRSQADVSHIEKIVSALGGFVSILCILIISHWSVAESAALIVASMGASAVLLFAVPHGRLSQPWPVAGGHIVSAIIGVACAQLVTNEIIAASLAVGLAIAAMYYLHCIHPPGGATALSAVLGGAAVQELGFQFIIAPVLLNVMIILGVAVLFNFAFPWRRYPASLYRQVREKDKQVSGVDNISHEDFVYALSEMDSFMDIEERDLIQIYDIATRKSQHALVAVDDIVVGNYYSNGKYGDDWSVRQVVDAPADETTSEEDIIVFKVAAGKNRRSSAYATRLEFAHWAKHQVERDEENWKRVK